MSSDPAPKRTRKSKAVVADPTGASVTALAKAPRTVKPKAPLPEAGNSPVKAVRAKGSVKPKTPVSVPAEAHIHTVKAPKVAIPATKGTPKVTPAKPTPSSAPTSAKSTPPDATPVTDELAKLRRFNPNIPSSSSAMHKNLLANMPANTGTGGRKGPPGPSPATVMKDYLRSRRPPPSPPVRSIWESYKALSRKQTLTLTAAVASFAVAGLYTADWYESNYLLPAEEEKNKAESRSKSV